MTNWVAPPPKAASISALREKNIFSVGQKPAFGSPAACAEASSPPVPQVITNFQARAVLIGQGYFDDVNDFVAGLGDATATAAWEYANEVTRNGALVAAVQAALGLTSQEMDALFVAAAGIEA